MSDLQVTDSEALTWPDGTLVDVDSIRANTDAAQQVAEPDPADRALRSPDWVIGELATVSHHAARMVVVIARAEELKRAASTALARRKAQLRWDHRALPAAQLTAKITLGCADEQDEYDRTVIAFEYARRIGNLLKDYTSRVQTIGKQVELVYRDAGRQ
ncbi:hypothetical protein [Microbacterium sp. NPDC080220]|uniref:hypothetical protein n=1 Tax=Microbacterium sp. NPDC080220 TaxID=3161017 RepID=UPI003441E9D5